MTGGQAKQHILHGQPETSTLPALNVSPTVSVIVVNWNCHELLRDCLKSLKLQDLTTFETIVVDNGSDDGSAEWLETQQDQIRLIRNAENRGFCAANNQGIEVARGNYIALLNNDATAHPAWLSELVATIESDNEVGMVASKIVRFDDPGAIDKAGHLIYPDGQNRGRGTGDQDRGQYDSPDETAWPDGCAALYRRDMLDEIGGFDEAFFAYADDAELGLRARIAGWTCLYAPRALVRHRVGSTLGRYSERRLFLIERNRIWLVAKLFPLRMWPMVPVYATLRWAATAWTALRGRGEAGQAASQLSMLGLALCIIRANVAALVGMPEILRKRARLRGLRKLSGGEVAKLLRRFRIPLKELAQSSRTRKPLR